VTGVGASERHGPRLVEERVAQIWARLGEVTDPELDEPVTELGFIEEVAVDAAGGVAVGFRLPTYWCSPNFAYLIADDIARAVRALPWVRAVRPELRDHMSAEAVNRGVGEGLSFGEAFAEFAVEGDLEGLRETFRRKAFQRRQEALILALREAGLDAGAIVAVRLCDLDALALATPEGERARLRYRAILVERGLARRPGDPALVTVDGEPIAAAGLQAHLQGLRGVRINMEANGALCRGLLEARYRDFDPAAGEPTLADFMLGRVPPRAAATA
jgi:metal-sulfur cluster biosynthetic enzyme